MATVFLTGFPGFLGGALVERLLDRLPENVTATCLVQAKFRKQAEARMAAIEAGQPRRRGRIELVEGDITRPDLGLSEGRLGELAGSVREIFHLAAVYDLGVARDLAMRVNVDGTRNVIRFAERCPGLRRLQYVSTCYVSGRYPGTFTEDDLEKGQPFNNFYEETKYLAEVEVQAAMRRGLPVTIYRPGIVVGDSRTGATQKYDGPYFLIRWILRWRSAAPVPVLGDPRRFELNVVPSDFVVGAIDYLSAQETSLGKVYQLANPAAPTIEAVLSSIAQASGRKLLRFPVTLPLAMAAMNHVPGLERWTGIEAQAIPYFSHPTRYTCANTERDLDGSGIACPTFQALVPHLVAYVGAHPDVPSAAMV